MFAKIITCILAAGMTACGLLVIRQHRIDAAHEMSDIHRRLLSNEEIIGRVRVKVHEELRQDRVVQMVRDYESAQGIVMTPLLLNECFGFVNPRALTTLSRAPHDHSVVSVHRPSAAGPDASSANGSHQP